ncbi:MAG: hypothetical protein ACOY3D_06215, partial [Candidatus Omnitrophota bacterium]
GISKRTGKAVRPDSDLDVAIEFEAFPHEDRFTTWIGESSKWKKELLGFLGFENEKHLDLQSYYGPYVTQYVKDGSIIIYTRP